MALMRSKALDGISDKKKPRASFAFFWIGIFEEFCSGDGPREYGCYLYQALTLNISTPTTVEWLNRA